MNTRVVAAGRLLSLVHRRGPLTRAAITAELGLARSAVGTALDELTALGLVRLADPPRPAAGFPAGRGRPSPVVEVDPTGPVVVAVHLLPDRVRLALVGLGQQVRHLSELPLGRTTPDPEAVIRRVAGLIAQGAGRTESPCVGTCVAMPGFVRESDGFVASSLHLNWSGISLAERLAALLPGGRSLTVGRASSLAALAEYRYGAGCGAASILTLNCEHLGIGGGFVTGGTLFTSTSTGTGYGLEAGHTIVETRGRQCPCGAQGCLEMYADARALLRAAGFPADQARDSPDRVSDVLSGAAAGDPAPAQAARVTARYLAAGLTSLVNVLSPERVVLTGFLAALHQVEAEVIGEALTSSSVVARAGQASVHTGSLPNAVLLGAADRAFSPLLTEPRGVLGASPA